MRKKKMKKGKVAKPPSFAVAARWVAVFWLITPAFGAVAFAMWAAHYALWLWQSM